MITVKTLVQLGARTSSLCPGMWSTHHRGVARTACRATQSVHECVGDVGHGGKHVCRCGALRSVYLENAWR